MSSSDKNVLFLCTGNSCRSQMAEAFARQYFPSFVKIYSAGIEKHGLNPYMLKVMEEIGVDMSRHYSKQVEELPKTLWHYVVTVCSHADQNCPYVDAENKLHWPFDDPPTLSQGKTDQEVLDIYRRVRDEICTKIQSEYVNFFYEI